MRVALAQINPTVGDFAGNQRKILEFIEKAKLQNANLIVFPEMAICGYPVWDLANKESFVQACANSLKEIAGATKNDAIAIAVGLIDFGSKKKSRNRNALALVHKGSIHFIQHKTLLPTYDVFLEQIFFEPADQYFTFQLNGFTIGATICEDIWDDQYAAKPCRILKERGVDFLINISASPYHYHAPMLRDEVAKRRVDEHKFWLIYTNQVGGQDDLVFDGRSFIMAPNGRVVARATAFKEDLLVTDISNSEKTASVDLEIDPVRDMYDALVLGVRDYVRKNGFKKVVLGLSGGIDSALVATLAADALGPSAVVGVTMPSIYSSIGSYADSEMLAKNLGIEFRKQAISDLYQKFLEQVGRRKIERNESVKPITLANENLQARLRGLELMYISNDENCLLLSTGNKSELAMGYCTLYGDMCGGLAVLGDVYKTDVYKLCNHRNTISEVIPRAIIDKAPSAELRPNQKDQDSLPPYEELDAILHRYIECNMSESEISKALAATGIKSDLVSDIIRRVEHNEYKRRQTPPLIRVTEKAWFGRRMPITNRFNKI